MSNRKSDISLFRYHFVNNLKGDVLNISFVLTLIV